MNEWLKVIAEPVDSFRVNLSFPGLECFLPVVALCEICVLATAVWLLVAGKYAGSRGEHP